MQWMYPAISDLSGEMKDTDTSDVTGATDDTDIRNEMGHSSGTDGTNGAYYGNIEDVFFTKSISRTKRMDVTHTAGVRHVTDKTDVTAATNS